MHHGHLRAPALLAPVQQVEELAGAEAAAAEAEAAPSGQARPVILLREKRKRDRRTETNYLVTLQGHAPDDGEW